MIPLLLALILDTGSLSSNLVEEWATVHISGGGFTLTQDFLGSPIGPFAYPVSPGQPFDASGYLSTHTYRFDNPLATLDGVPLPWFYADLKLISLIPSVHAGFNTAPFTLTGVVFYNLEGVEGRFTERIDLIGSGTARIYLAIVDEHTLGTSSVHYDLAATSMPEPATWILLLTGLGLLLCVRPNQRR